MTAYSNFGEIDVQKATFNLNNMLNDMIKLNVKFIVLINLLSMVLTMMVKILELISLLLI